MLLAATSARRIKSESPTAKRYVLTGHYKGPGLAVAVTLAFELGFRKLDMIFVVVFSTVAQESGPTTLGCKREEDNHTVVGLPQGSS